jgi:glycosyltransferase involved in cell wall biosynthesis
MNPLISIVIPGYNAAWCIPQLILNLREVLTENAEVVFVDDGSTDGSLDLFRKLLPEAVCVRQNNCGVGAARNHGVSVARGKYVQLLDADDTLVAGKLQAQLLQLERYKGDVVYSDWRMCVVKGGVEKLEPVVHPMVQQDIIGSLLGGWWFPTASALIRKSTYESCGGCDPTLHRTCDDFHLWIQMAIAGAKYQYLPGYFSNYYRYEDRLSISRTNQADFFRGEETIVENALAELSKTNQATVSRQAAAARRLHSIARNVYPVDRNWYARLMHRIKELNRNFSPTGSVQYRALWNIGGHQMAEWVACRLRRSPK